MQRSIRLLSKIALAPAALLMAVAQSGPSPSIRALEFYRHGDCKQAMPLFKEVLERQPKNTPVRKLYATCLARSGQQDEARAQYRMVLTVSPDDPEAIQALGPSGNAAKAQPRPTEAPAQQQVAQADALLKAHKPAAAEKLLDKTITSAPASVAAKQRLAELYSSTKRYDQAAGEYVALARETNRAAYLLRAAENRTWSKQYEQAAALFREYLTRSPADLPARLELANALMWWGRFDDADPEFRSYLQRNPANAEARLSFANVLLWNARYADALEQFEALKASQPRDVRPVVGMAQAYERMGQLDLALKSYQEALKRDPADATAREARTRLEADLPRQKAFESIQANNNADAAKYFIEYLKQHPESDETVLEAARAYSWAKKPRQASPYFAQYLKRKPDDVAARRELAKNEMAIPDYAAARQAYEELVGSGAANTEDYEQLVHAYVWDNKVADAQPAAMKLAALDPNNAVARETIEAYRTGQKAELLERARTLAAEKRFPEAIDVYREYSKRFGDDTQAELKIARLYSWSGMNREAVTAYHAYLLKNPSDAQARVEMAKVESWSKDYHDAATDFRDALKTDPGNTDALLGIAQVTDESTHDAFSAIRGYRAALASDPQNATARERIAELTPAVSPSVGDGFKSFGDSDGFYRAVNTIEGSIPFAAGVRLTPYYETGYFHQLRQVGGATCDASSPDFGAAAAALSEKICDRNGTYWGNGAGVRAQVGSLLGSYFLADIGDMRIGGATSIWTAHANLTLALSDDQRLSFQIIRGPAAYDVNTVAALAAGIAGETALASYTTRLSDKWSIGAQIGVTHYTEGDGGFSTNLQRRLSTQLSYSIAPGFSAGYYVRYSSFQRDSPLYFSPQNYGEYGFAYRWQYSISKRTRFIADGEIGLGHIHRFNTDAMNTVEIAIEPAIAWQITPGLEFRLGYRVSRSRASAFGSPAYTTGGADFGLTKSLGNIPQTTDASQLNLH